MKEFLMWTGVIFWFLMVIFLIVGGLRSVYFIWREDRNGHHGSTVKTACKTDGSGGAFDRSIKE